MTNKYLRLFIFFVLCISLVACTDENKAEEKPKEEKIPNAVINFKAIMNQNPGKLSGGKYSEEAVKKELDTFPKNLTDQEYFDRLVYLFAENYQPHYATMQIIDPSIPTNDATSRSEVSDIWSKKYKELDQARSEIFRIEKREEKRIKKAIEYLSGSGIIKEKNEIMNMVWDRHRCITSGNIDEYDRVNNLLSQEKEAAEERIEKKEAEGGNL